MADERPPVPAVPSVVLALGESLEARLEWLERRFRGEIGAVYPGSLLRFRVLAREEEATPEALHALCDPLLVHPLWLGLQERGLAPGGEQGPRLSVCAIAWEQDPEGCRLLGPLAANLRDLYRAHFTPDLSVFYVGLALDALPRLEDAGRPVPCYVLGPVKQYGYRTATHDEPFETIRLALNAHLASNAAGEVEALLEPGGAVGLAPCALGASAIAVARGPMETWVRNRVVQRLAKACLASDERDDAPPGSDGAARAAVAEFLGLAQARGAAERPAVAPDLAAPVWAAAGEPDEVWERSMARRISGLTRRWANEVLRAWGVEVRESRRGYWRVVVHTEGDLHRRLQRMLSVQGEELEDAQALLAQDLARLANALRRHFGRRVREVLWRWSAVPGQIVGSGPGCLVRMQAVVTAATAGLERAAQALERQRAQPVWLRSDGDAVTLAGVLGAQLMPVRSAAERARLGYVPVGWVALRLLPLTLLLGAAGGDLRPDWGLAGGLGLGLSFTAVAAALQARWLRHGSYGGVREVCRLYEARIGGVVLAEARGAVQRLQEAVAVTAAQVRGTAGELAGLAGIPHFAAAVKPQSGGTPLASEAGDALAELSRPPDESVYLERQLADRARCAAAADEVAPEALLTVPAEGEGDASPSGLLAATLRGELPAAAIPAGLVETVSGAIARQCAPVETRIEELLVDGQGQPFSAAATLESLHQRALPLWPGDIAAGPELDLAVMSREAAVAFRGWLAGHGGNLRLLPTLQRDRITYLRLRPVGGQVIRNA